MIELITSALVLVSVFYGTPVAHASTADTQSYTKNIQVEDRNIVDGIALIATGGNRRTVEIDVREYFEDTPILAEIARCESQFRHIGSKGNLIRGKIDNDDVGVMQINTYFHSKEAEKLGLNLKTLQGNMAYAKALYEKEGTTPWLSSSKCWQKYELITKK